MKGKKFIVIMAIFIIICSIQACVAFEDTNITQSVVSVEDVNVDSDLDIGGDNSAELSSVQEDVTNDDLNVVDTNSDSVDENQIVEIDDSSVSVKSSPAILSSSSDVDILGAVKTPGVFVYGVDYDNNYASSDKVPLERFFKAIFYGIRDYIQNQEVNKGKSPTLEWNVFLNNKTFTGGYGDAGVGTIQTGYSSEGNRVSYLALNGLGGFNGADKIKLIIHLYGGSSVDDTRKSTLDLSNYGASYALLDFSTENSSISGINFVNFNVNDHSNTVDSGTTTPFIKLGDASNPSYRPELLIKDCTFENITLNPNQPIYEVGVVQDYDIIKDYYSSFLNSDEVPLDRLFKSLYWGLKQGKIDKQSVKTREWNVYLHNKTYTGGYGFDGVSTIQTGYKAGSNQRVTYFTLRGWYDFDITLYIYGGISKTDAKTSTLDLSKYGADYKLFDLSGGASSITGVNFVNFDVNKVGKTADTGMPLIIIGDDAISNYQSKLVNCTFENITLNPKQPIVRMAYQSNPQDGQPIYSGGCVENCTFLYNSASQLLVISGSIPDSKHSDDGPVFYGFNASGNTFIGNVANAQFDSNLKSLGFCFKIWNEVVNVTLDRNTFINNTNAVHGAAYCIIGFNATITNNYIEGNQAVYGAGIEAHNGNITIRDSIFVDNVAKGNHSQNSYRDGSGAAIALLGSNNYIVNCTFINNTAYGHAGAIDIVGGFKTLSDGTKYYLIANNTVIESSRFYDNLALDYAGGVHINGTNTKIDNCTFERNNASYAGAVRLFGENATIVNSSFDNNNAIQGGACYIEGENAHIFESTFYNNDATHNLSKVRENDTRISAGGAIYVIGSFTVVTNNTFINNSANRIKSKGILEGFGGALYLDGKNLTFKEGEFINNTAILGGAAYINGNGINATLMNFTNNTAIQGGAVYVIGIDTIISNSTFYNNNATRSVPGLNTTGTGSISVVGGAIDIVGYNVLISESEFIENYAVNGDGGAIAIDGHLANITNNTFKENEAIHGGAIYIDSVSTNSNIETANFTENKAVEGGAIFIKGSNTNIGNANFTNNNATHDLSFEVNNDNLNINAMGGAIGIVGNNSVIYNSTFFNNTAVGKTKESYGGAIAIQGYNTTLEGNGFTFNQAVIGGALYFSGTLNDVNDTDFINNSAVQGGAIYIANSDATFGHSGFYNNSATHDLRFDLESDELKKLITIGGAVYIPGNSIYVYDSEFINNTAYGLFKEGGLGGAIAVNGSHDYIINSTFLNNQAIKGGAFYLEGNDTNIIGSNFTNNCAIVGGVAYIDGTYSLVENSTFNENYATHDNLRFDVSDELKEIPTVAGAINIIGENINISSSNFTNNKAVATSKDDSLGAGAIYVEGNNATISDSLFDSNQALKGGAIFIVVNNTDITNCNFTSNHAFNFTNAEGLGGAVYLENASDSDFVGCEFVNNTASVNGGAIDWHEGCVDGLISNCSFTNNSAASNGGAIFWFGEGGVIKDSNFTNNKANGTVVSNLGNSGDGGAIIWTGSNGLVDGCEFVDNYAKEHGGAVFLRGVSGRADCTNNSFVNSKFENNTAGINGGAIDWNEGANQGSIKNSSFVTNSAKENGGAVFWHGHEGSIIDSNFTKNTASNGGAVFWSGIIGEINGSRFISNNATEGGAIFLQNCSHGDVIDLEITDSYFENNTAVNDGGAINWNDGKSTSVKSSEFVNNTAKRGGAIFVDADDDALITKSKFSYNEAILGGAIYSNMDDISVVESDFEYNNAVQGGAIYIAANNNKIDNSNFNYNNATYSLRVDLNGDKHKTKGGAIYIAGENNVISNSKFYNNTAYATNDTSYIVQTTPGLLGAHLVTEGVDDDGLGGAIYIDGNNNEINSNEFDYNVARNGSAIYNNASGSYFKDGLFVKNQAWSYVLEVNATPGKFYHGNDIPVNVYKYVAGDNILNGIYNAKDVSDVTFNNVGYIINDDADQIRNTPSSDINPVLGATEGKLYQDSLERYQHIVVEIISNETGETVIVKEVLTDLYGNRTFKLSGSESLKLTPGNYSIKAYHPEDRNYKYIVTANIFEVVPLVKLNIEKTADKEDYGVGDEITFTINVTNKGNSNATNVVVKDTLPDGLSLMEGYDLTYTFDLKVNESKIITVKALATREGKFTNVASANCDENNTIVKDNVTVPVFNPNLQIVKNVNKSSVIVGNLVNFTINVTNNGMRDATGVLISDIIDTDAFSIEDYSSVLKLDGNKLSCNIDKLEHGQSYVVWIVVKTLTNGTFNNTASVNCSEEPAVKNSTVSVKAGKPDLNVTKVALEDVAYNGQLTSFKIIVTNTGDIDLTGLFIDEIIPEGLIYDHFIGSKWTKSGNMFYYDGSLEVGGKTELIVVVKPTKSGNFTNSIIAGSDDVDNHTANASIKVYTPSLNVREISNNPNVVVGESVSFTVVVTNDGDCDLGDVYVTNYFPKGLVYTGFNGDGWIKLGDRFVYSGVLKPGESITYDLFFGTVEGGSFVPRVVAGSNLTSNATAKARSNNITHVIVPNITVTKVSDKQTVKVGELVIFTITVKNTGECKLGDIFVIDQIPDGLEFVRFTGDGWTKTGDKYLYDGILDPNESVSIIIVCKAINAVNVTNVVIAGSNMTGNVSDSADVSIIEENTPNNNNTNNNNTSVPNNIEEKIVNVVVDEKATGNPVMMLLLVIFAIIPLRRREQ